MTALKMTYSPCAGVALEAAIASTGEARIRPRVGSKVAVASSLSGWIDLRSEYHSPSLAPRYAEGR